ncbi:MAG: zinc metallopeptidase [Eubacteriales bacterium]
MPFFFYDPTYILVIIAFLISLWAQIKVKSAYAKYSKVPTRVGMTGAGAADTVLRSGGVTDVGIVGISGELTDNYNPRTNVISLSKGVIDKTSVAAVGVAAHEAGHALQYAEGYAPIKFRMAIIPVCNIASQLAWPLFALGLVFNTAADAGGGIGYWLMQIGIYAFSFAVLFQLVTLPVEVNASRRALTALRASGSFTDEELSGAKKVLTAAAMTYLAALAGSLLQLLRLILIASSRNNRRRD